MPCSAGFPLYSLTWHRKRRVLLRGLNIWADIRMRNHCCVSVVNKCFLALYCVEFGTNSEVTTLPCINKPVYELIVQIERPLVFLGYLF